MLLKEILPWIPPSDHPNCSHIPLGTPITSTGKFYVHSAPRGLNNSSPIDQMQKPCTTVQPTSQPLSAYSSKHEADQRWKQLQAEHPQHNQKFYGLSHYAPTPSIITIQQLGLGITHAFSTLIVNSFKKLVHSQTTPAIDHYDFLLPRDQLVGLLLDNSLDVEM